MVPPPDNMGDEFPDFDSMTPEEQMAWLESLAKRQGADEQQFTTAADLDIPIPENAVIDEPGYVPYSISEKPVGRVEEEPEPIHEVLDIIDEDTLLLEREVEAVGEDILEMAEPEDEFAPLAAVEDQADPMQWLSSLSAEPPGEQAEIVSSLDAAFHQVSEGADELEDLFSEIEQEVDSEAFEPGAAFETVPEESPEFELAEETAVESDEMLIESEAESFDVIAEQELADFAEIEVEDAAIGADDDPLGGVDPMLWLESLAARQGAKPEELLTTADLEVEQPADDTVVDEPGYVPYDIVAGGPRAPKVSPELEPVSEEAEIAEEAFEPSLELESELAALVEGTVLSEAEAAEWLDALGEPPVVEEEEPELALDFDIPEMAEPVFYDEVIEEPQNFGIPELEYDEEFVLPTELPEPVAETPAESALAAADESLSWLEDLAAEPEQDMADVLAFGDELLGDVDEAVESLEEVAEAEGDEVPSVVVPTEVSADPLADMTDEEVARAQARGELTPHQELAWLKRQAAKLAEARETQESEVFDVDVEEIQPAQPADLPGWLQEMRDEAEAQEIEAVEEIVPLIEEGVLEIEDGGLPDWLQERAPDVEGELPALAFDTDDDMESLWADAAEDVELPEVEPIPDSELAAFLAGDFVPEEADPLADALDAEYERRIAGDESEPEWYTEAVSQVIGESAAELATLPEEGDEVPDLAPMLDEQLLAEATRVEMPDWLQSEDEEPVLVGEEPVPDWLTEPVAEPVADLPISDEEVSDWLAEPEPEIEKPAGIDWFSEKVVEPVVEDVGVERVVSVPPIPIPSVIEEEILSEIEPPVPVAAIPEGELFEQYRQRLEEDPGDYVTRLALARALRTSNEIPSSLDHYEVIIKATQLLQDLSNDLGQLVGEHPTDPRIRRLLGDTYMRQGLLQKALDSYRSALEQL